MGNIIWPSRFATAGLGAVPTYFGTGGYAGGSNISSVAPAFPVGVQADDIALLHASFHDGSSSPGSQTITTPAGFTLVDFQGPTNIGATSIGYLFWKRCSGSEGGTTVTVNASETSNTEVYGSVISVFRGCKASGTPYEGIAHKAAAATTTHTSDALTTLGPNRLALFIVGHRVATNASTAGSWAELYDFTTAAGNDAGVYAYSVAQAAAGAVTPASITMGLSAGYIAFTLALLPA